MDSDKYTWPTGLKPTFLKKFWHLCGSELFNSRVSWLETSQFPPQVNKTTIFLIPKKSNPTTMKDFWLIVLCNVIYKIMSKVLANGLKLILPKCISPKHSAFIQDRSILDNVLIVSEIIHHIRCKQKGKLWEIAFKIDISKKIYWVDSNYLFGIMGKMGFNKKWINWMRICFPSIQF